MRTRKYWLVAIVGVFANCGFPRPPIIGDDGSGDDEGKAYQLLALEPAVATTGDTITLEGTFDQAALVRFSGAPPLQATILGPHRASVVVPSGALAGDLTVETNGITIGPLPFRRTSFALEVQPFRRYYEQTSDARQMPALVTARSGHSAVIIGDRIYVIGGAGRSGMLSSVETALINADGTLGAFVVASVSLTTARSAHTSIVVKDSLYVIGGAGNEGPLTSIERAIIHADGSLGPFVADPNTGLVTPRSSHASEIVGNNMYVIGGIGGQDSELDSIERAAINSDGTLGLFATLPDATLRLARHGHSSNIIGTSLYVIGGRSNSTLSGSIEQAAINGEGSLGTFTILPGTTLATPRSEHTSDVIGDALYIVGGNQQGTVERASIKTNSSLSSFSVSSTLSPASGRGGHTTALVGDFLYLLGGSDDSGVVASVQRASINGSGLLGTFSAGGGLSTPRYGHRTVNVGNSIIVIGGSSSESLDSLEQATLHTDGSLESFAPLATARLATGRTAHTVAVIGNSIYVIGGIGNNGQDSVERATIHFDGSIGSFAIVPGLSASPGLSPSSAIIENRLYIIGGCCDAQLKPFAQVLQATIRPDGTLSEFSTSVTSLVTGRYGHRSAVLGSYLYVFGGFATLTGDLGTVERAQIGADGSLGAFSTVGDTALMNARSGCATEIVGDTLYIIGGGAGEAVLGNLEQAKVGADGTLGPFSLVPALMLGAARAGATSVIAGNTLYVFGGSQGHASNIVPLGNIEEAVLP